MKKTIKIDNMRNLWGTPNEDINILFNRALQPIENHPIVVFKSQQTEDYFFLSFRTKKPTSKQYRGEIEILKEKNNFQDVDSYLDTTQIHWATKEVFETLFEKKEIKYITEVFTPEQSILIYENIYKNIKEKPPFVSLMKISLNNNKVIPELLYSNQKLLKMSCDDNLRVFPELKTYFESHQKMMKSKNKIFENKIDLIAGAVNGMASELINDNWKESNPQTAIEYWKQKFNDVKDEEVLNSLARGKKTYEDIEPNHRYFQLFANDELIQWRNDNYGDDWQYHHKNYEKYSKKESILKSAVGQKVKHYDKPKNQSSGGMKM